MKYAIVLLTLVFAQVSFAAEGSGKYTPVESAEEAMNISNAVTDFISTHKYKCTANVWSGFKAKPSDTWSGSKSVILNGRHNEEAWFASPMFDRYYTPTTVYVDKSGVQPAVILRNTSFMDLGGVLVSKVNYVATVTTSAEYREVSNIVMQYTVRVRENMGTIINPNYQATEKVLQTFFCKLNR